MPYPEIYTNVLFAAVIVFCAVVSASSVFLYNALHKNDLLSGYLPSERASSPVIYILCAVFGVAVGIGFAIKDISFADIFLILMIPAAVTVAISDALNGFIPVIGIVFSGICAVLRAVAVCVEESALWPALTFALGGVFGVLIMLLINFIAKKTGAEAADGGHIALVATIIASAGIVPGTAALAASAVAALLFYILPLYFIAKKNGEKTRISSVRYPLAPFLIFFFYAFAVLGIFR